MPWLRSIISLSIASVRPSIRATPSPISLMTPTFSLPAGALAPAICSSISNNRFDIHPQKFRSGTSKTLLQRAQLRLNALVIDITSHFDPHPRDQLGVLCERDADPRAVQSHETGLDPRLQFSFQRCYALDFGGMLGNVESHQPFKMCCERQGSPQLGSKDRPHHLLNAPLIQESANETKPKKGPGLTFDLLSRFHTVHPALVKPSRIQLHRCFLGQSLLVFRCQNLISDCRSGLHNQPAHFPS